jgi:transcriptional regulator with XRE-family HTH domain
MIREQRQVQLGKAVRRLRLERDIDQQTVCELAGVSRHALRNLELGRGATVATLVSVVDALGGSEWLDALCPPVTVSPMALLRLEKKLQQQQPRRARRKKG